MPKEITFKLTPSPVFINVQILVERVESGGNAGNGKYEISSSPKGINVTSPNAVVSYQLINPTPGDIVFVGMTKVRKHPTPQLSTPSISLDGRMMVLADGNNDQDDIETTLYMAVPGDDQAIVYDPEITNSPGKTFPALAHDSGC